MQIFPTSSSVHTKQKHTFNHFHTLLRTHYCQRRTERTRLDVRRPVCVCVRDLTHPVDLLTGHIGRKQQVNSSVMSEVLVVAAAPPP